MHINYNISCRALFAARSESAPLCQTRTFESKARQILQPHAAETAWYQFADAVRTAGLVSPRHVERCWDQTQDLRIVNPAS